MYEGTLYRVFFCLLSLGVVDAYPCSGALTVSASRVVVKYGDPVEVNCTANVHHYGMGWEATIGNKAMDEDVQVMAWTVYRVWDWEVETRCYVNLEDGETQCVEEVAVVVYKDLAYAPTLSVNHQGPLAEGATYLLQCHVRDVAPARYLDVTWYKGDEVIPSANPLHSSYPSYPSNVTASLWITPMREDDGAQFRCEAGLRLGEGGPQPPPPRMASPSLGITVHYGPVLYNCSNSELHVPEGESLESYCTARANPSPTVSWRQYRNGDLVDPRQPLSRGDRGRYSYSVTGGVRSKHLLLTIEVLYGPEILCRSNFSIEEYKPYEPPCMVVGFPPPDVQWFKEGEEIVLPERLSRADQGKYHILAGSSHGVADHWLDLRVLYPPTPIVELEDTEVYYLGSDATLKCSSTGDPRPQYRWSYFQEENVRVNTEDGVSLLHINRVSGLNIGTYTCCAFNRLGEVCRTVRVTVRGVQASCPIKFSSAGQSVEKQVVEYDKNVSINCHAKGHTSILWIGLSPEATWTEKALTDWNIEPVCKAEFLGLEPCRKLLPLILYKSPKSVSLNVPSYSGGPLVNNENYTLLCEVEDVAPVKNLVITWYKHRHNNSERIYVDTFQDNDIKTPQDMNSTLIINATRSVDGARYWCEAKLDLGEETPTLMESKPFNATVHYAPVITQPNASVVPVFRDYEEVLVCEAEGNPKPTITWSFHNKTVFGSNLTINMEMVGEITCWAVNKGGNTTKRVQLVFREDYLPLIAGFVAVVVVIISVIFVFIYSIYYTNTKMGRYSIEGAKPNPLNGDVARNGLDSNPPIMKLSQQNIYAMCDVPSFQPRTS